MACEDAKTRISTLGQDIIGHLGTISFCLQQITKYSSIQNHGILKVNFYTIFRPNNANHVELHSVRDTKNVMIIPRLMVVSNLILL